MPELTSGLPSASGDGDLSGLSGPPPWVVFTGAPCSGKTTTAVLLEGLGYKVVPEVTRLVLRKKLRIGLPLIDADTKQALARLVWQKKVEIESNLPRDTSFILDRALPDSIVYAELAGQDSALYRSVCEKHFNYRRIFLFEPLPFSLDELRTTEEQALVPQFHDRLGRVYAELGYKVQVVRACSLAERVDFIRRELERLGIERYI